MSAIDHPTRIIPGHKKIASTTLHATGKRQAGFIQGVLLFGIALLAVVIAAFSFSNKSSSNSTAAEEAKTYASTIISHGNSIKSATERFRLDRGGLFSQADGTLTLTNLMDFTDNQYKGLYNVNDRFITALTVQPKAYTNNTSLNTLVSSTSGHAAGSFYLRVYTGVGDENSPIKIAGKGVRHLLSTTGVTEATCRRINVNLHGPTFSSIAIPRMTAGTLADFATTNGNFENATGTITITGKETSGGNFPGVTDLEEGCAETASGSIYVYFKVLNRQGT